VDLSALIWFGIAFDDTSINTMLCTDVKEFSLVLVFFANLLNRLKL